MRGIWTTFRSGGLNIPLMPTFHPAYLLRNYTPETRKLVWSDMQAVMQKVSEALCRMRRQSDIKRLNLWLQALGKREMGQMGEWRSNGLGDAESQTAE